MKTPLAIAVILAAALPTGLAQNSLTPPTTPPPPPTGNGRLLAFAGAEGFGRFATGGNGGQLYHVTNLSDAGPGSFREAVSQPNRTVVFDVGGMITLQSNVSVSSHLTIAGQTAPGDGIVLYGRTVGFSNRSTPATDVIVRYLRFRQGINGDAKKCAVSLCYGSSNMIFDHCSIEWGRWDCLGVTTDSHDLTFQYCIIGEGIAPQRFGSLTDSANRVTYTHNLWINNHSRNPKAKGTIQYINNVVYNWELNGLCGGHSGSDHFLDVVGNYFVAGPSTHKAAAGQFTATDQVFQSGNYVDLNRDGRLNGRPMVPGDFGAGAQAPTLRDQPGVGPLAGLRIEEAPKAFEMVLAGAGCSLRRDAVDARLIAQARSLGREGKIISSEVECKERQ